MNIRIFAAALNIVAVTLPVAAQDNTANSEGSAPQPDDRLKTLGGQLLQELFTRATTRKAKTPPDPTPDATNETYVEPVADTQPESFVEPDTYTVDEDAAMATETAPPATSAEPYLRSQRRTKRPAIPRPQ